MDFHRLPGSPMPQVQPQRKARGPQLETGWRMASGLTRWPWNLAPASITWRASGSLKWPPPEEEVRGFELKQSWMSSQDGEDRCPCPATADLSCLHSCPVRCTLLPFTPRPLLCLSLSLSHIGPPSVPA